MTLGDGIAGLALVVGLIGGIFNFFYTKHTNNRTKQKELNDILAELHMVRNEYIRFDRATSNPPTDERRSEHMRIVSRAQYLVRRAAWYKTIDDSLNDAYEKAKTEILPNTNDISKLQAISDRGKYSLPFIAKTRLTVNQTLKAQVASLDPGSQIDLKLFDDYSARNISALDDAITAIEKLLHPQN